MPNKFLAFSSPVASSPDKDGYIRYTPADYVQVFRAKGVTAVVRLNEKAYNAQIFKEAGIKHYELYFRDGSIPNERII